MPSGLFTQTEHMIAKAALRQRALEALKAVTLNDPDVLERAKKYLEELPIVRTLWKDSNPRCAGAVLCYTMNQDVFTVSGRVHISLWTDLCNWMYWYPAEAVALFEDAIKQVPSA